MLFHSNTPSRKRLHIRYIFIRLLTAIKSCCAYDSQSVSCYGWVAPVFNLFLKYLVKSPTVLSFDSSHVAKTSCGCHLYIMLQRELAMIRRWTWVMKNIPEHACSPHSVHNTAKGTLMTFAAGMTMGKAWSSHLGQTWQCTMNCRHLP